LLAVFVMAAFLILEVVLANKIGASGWLRVFGWSIGVYSLGVACYVGYWWWQMRAEMKRRMQQGPSKDRLTGVLDWNGLSAELSKERYIQADGERKVRLVHVELSDLERVNHDYGNLVGDRVLQEVALLLKSSVAEGWIVGRVGGREFMVVAAMATPSDAEGVSQAVQRAVKGFSLDLGRLGKVGGLRARVSQVEFSAGDISLNKALARVRSSGAFSVPSAGAEGASAVGCYHLPEITLGAAAVHRFERLGGDRKSEFHLWRQAPARDFVDVMAEDMARLVDTRAEKGDIQFVTAPPFPADAVQQRATAEALGRKVAERLGIPFRRVLRCTVLGSDMSQHIEPEVDSDVDAGACVMLVQDLISGPVLMRRSVRALSRHGCHVLPLVWAVQAESQ